MRSYGANFINTVNTLVIGTRATNSFCPITLESWIMKRVQGRMGISKDISYLGKTADAPGASKRRQYGNTKGAKRE